MALLEISNLDVRFATPRGVLTAVHDLSFSIAAGETLAIVGESGCGKSVTSMSVLRLVPEPPGRVRGAVRFDNREVLALTEREMRGLRGKDIGMIFQEPMTSLNPVLTVGRQIGETLRVHEGLSARAAAARAVDMLALVGISEPERRVGEYPHQLSGGMRQRVMIAIALACTPRLLIADEPTTALDVTIQAQILDLMRDLKLRVGAAIMLITHDLGVVAEVCKNVLVMYGGNLVEYGTAEQIFENPRMPYTQGLLASLPRVDDTTHRRLEPIKGQPPNLLRLPPGCAFAPRCSYRMPVCDQPVPLYDFGEGHVARCFLYDERYKDQRTIEVESAKVVSA